MYNMRKLFSLFVLGFMLTGVFSFAFGSYAQGCNGAPDCFDLSTVNPLGTSEVTVIVCNVALFLQVKLMPPIAVLMVLWASFLYLTSAGSPGNVTSAKQILVYTIIGAGILIIAPALIALVIDIFGKSTTVTTATSTCSTLASRSEEHTSELQSQSNLACRLLL